MPLLLLVHLYIPHFFVCVKSDLAKLHRRGKNFQRKFFGEFLLPSLVSTKWIYQDVNFLENLSGDGSPLDTSGNSRDEAWIERKQSQFSVTFSMASPFSYRTSLCLRPDFLVFLFTQADICVKEERENPTRCKWHWCFFPLFFQMQQLGNMKDNFDDLSDPEQFACLVNARQFVFINLKRKILRLRGIVCFLWSTSCTG